MYSGDRDSLTICAVSTPPGRGGISVIRVSGPLAGSMLTKTLRPAPFNLTSHKSYYGHFVNPEIGQPVDEVLISFFQKGRSFTGDEVIEISCHGNPLICDEILATLSLLGCHSALPGEFTYRAFMNDRIDLVQAEAVLGVIEGRSQKGVQKALRYLGGELSSRISLLSGELTKVLAHVEASIDFSSEGLETLSAADLRLRLAGFLGEIEALVSGYDRGRGLKDGFHGLFCGAPNVGKSSLFNLMVGEERSIVTDTAGTTRDVVEGEAFYNGSRFCLFDTAGLRSETLDQIEILGQDRVWKHLPRMDFAFYVVNKTAELSLEDIENIQKILHLKIPLMILRNKLDHGPFRETQESVAGSFVPVLQSSARNPAFRDFLWSSLESHLRLANVEDEALVFSARQRESLTIAAKALKEALQMADEKLGSEFLALPLMEALKSLHELLGMEFDDAVMDRVFQEFCLGK